MLPEKEGHNSREEGGGKLVRLGRPGPTPKEVKASDCVGQGREVFGVVSNEGEYRCSKWREEFVMAWSGAL